MKGGSGSTPWAGPTALDSSPIWDALQHCRVAALRCSACDLLLHPPRPRCPNCGSGERILTEVDGDGEVYASTTVEVAADPRWQAPYTVVLVDVKAAPGLRLVGYLPGRWQLRPGDPVVPVFWDEDDGVVRLSWVPRDVACSEVASIFDVKSKRLLDERVDETYARPTTKQGTAG